MISGDPLLTRKEQGGPMDIRRVSVPGTSVGAQAALEALGALWADHGLSRAVTWPVEIAVDEVLAELVQRSLEGRGATARVDLEILLDTLASPPWCEVVVSDDGPPDVTDGAALVPLLMDEAEYERRDGRNRLRLRRRLVPLELPEQE
jgi:hypothetical protein